MSCKKKTNPKIEPEPIVSTSVNAGYRYYSVDKGDGNHLMLAMWYPTNEKEEEYNYNTTSAGLVVKGKVKFNGTESSGQHPFIVFSHGFSGGGIGSVEICEALAREGYYVFVPDHSDAIMSVRIQGESNGTLDEALDYLTNINPFGNGENYVYRVTEIQKSIDFINASNFNIDKSKMILGGHSMGGWTVMKFMNESELKPKAMFLFSMGELNWLHNESRYFEASFFEQINFPTAYFYGGGEYGQAIDAGLGNVYAAFCFTHSPSPSYGLIVKQGNHFTYNSEAIAPSSHGSSEQLMSINNRLMHFLSRHIKGNDIAVTSESEDVKK